MEGKCKATFKYCADKVADQMIAKFFWNLPKSRISFLVLCSCKYGSKIVLQEMKKKLFEGKLPRSSRKRLKEVLEEFENEMNSI